MAGGRFTPPTFAAAICDATIGRPMVFSWA
jgi:hypothetical protein